MAVDTSAINTRARLRQVPVQELVLPVVIIALIIVGVIIRPGVFLTSDNLLNVLTQASITGTIAIGMTFVIATGGIDLSVGSVLAAASIAGGLLTEYGSWIFMLGALGMAVLLGAINGLAIINEQSYRGRVLTQAEVQADILAASVSAALAFDDAPTMREYVDALAANPQIVAAGVYGPAGQRVVEFTRRGAAPPPKTTPPKTTPPPSWS